MKQPAIFRLSVGFVGGVLAASFLSPAGGIIACGIAVALALKSRRISWLMIVAAALGVGRIWASPLQPSASDIAALVGKQVTGTGVVESFPDRGSDSQKTVVEMLVDRYQGKVLVVSDPYPLLQPDDRITVTGKVQKPSNFNNFDYQSFLARDNIHTVMYRPKVAVLTHEPTLTRQLYQFRQAFQARLQSIFTEPSGSFLLGILFGERATIPDDLEKSFQRTGTTHVLALSGYNISILIAVIVKILGRRPSVLWLCFVLIGAFVMMVGPDAPVIRAALMGSFILLGQMLGRPQMAILACIVTAAAMLAWNPWCLRYDLGFDLSFLATLGILKLEPAISSRLQATPNLLRSPIAATLAATVPTAPLIALNFGMVSLVSPLANLLLVPAVPFLMLSGFVTTMVDFVNHPLAMATTLPVDWFIRNLLNAISWMGNLPAAAVVISEAKPALALAVTGCCFYVVQWLKPWSIREVSRV